MQNNNTEIMFEPIYQNGTNGFALLNKRAARALNNISSWTIGPYFFLCLLLAFVSLFVGRPPYGVEGYL